MGWGIGVGCLGDVNQELKVLLKEHEGIVQLNNKKKGVWGAGGLDLTQKTKKEEKTTKTNQTTNRPVNAHLISLPSISTKHTKPGKNKVKKWP